MARTQRLFSLTSGHFPRMRERVCPRLAWQKEQLNLFGGERLCPVCFLYSLLLVLLLLLFIF